MKARFGKDFAGPIIPMGAEVTYKPITDKDKSRLHSLGAQVLKGVFLGYSQHAGGGWTGDVVVIDWEQCEDAEHISEIYHKIFKAGEVFVTKKGGNFVFP